MAAASWPPSYSIMTVHQRLVTIGLLLLTACTACWAGDVVVIHGKRTYAFEQNQIEQLAQFYGIAVLSFAVDPGPASAPWLERVKSSDTLAVFVSQDALSDIDLRQLESALHRKAGRNTPVLVYGIDSDSSSEMLKLWSHGAIKGCASSSDFRAKALQVGNLPELTQSLSGMQLPAVVLPQCAIQTQSSGEAISVLEMLGDRGTRTVLSRVTVDGPEVFFVPQLKPGDESWMGKPSSLPQAFSSMAPFIIFLRYAVGEYGWHLDGHYANLTIDDAWLTQPYGHLDYQGLLDEMRRHNFHTTVAFIPWNYDRSRPDVVNVVRDNPDRFSICIHGNDHNHREFGDYSSNSLAEQSADIKQGIARMERFQTLTDIPYDRFMVFPHAIAPEKTLAELKKYNFLGTANSQDVPLHVSFPTNPTFLLRPFTVEYADFPSFSRRSEFTQLDVTIDSFLGNPLLFYGHENLFDTGIDAFNATADLVNRLETGTKWVRLGEIARHLYLLRRRTDGGFDVQMLASQIDLTNPTDTDTIFYINKSENIPTESRLLSSDGLPIQFEESADLVAFRIRIPAHQIARIKVAYRNDLDLSREDIGRTSPYPYALRMVSDLRDLYLSKVPWGREVTRSYYRWGWDSLELDLERQWWTGVICLLLLVFGVRHARRVSRDKTAERTPSRGE